MQDLVSYFSDSLSVEYLGSDVVSPALVGRGGSWDRISVRRRSSRRRRHHGNNLAQH